MLFQMFVQIFKVSGGWKLMTLVILNLNLAQSFKRHGSRLFPVTDTNILMTGAYLQYFCFIAWQIVTLLEEFDTFKMSVLKWSEVQEICVSQNPVCQFNIMNHHLFVIILLAFPFYPFVNVSSPEWPALRERSRK